MRKRKPASRRRRRARIYDELLRLRLIRARLQTKAVRRSLGIEDHLRAQDPEYRRLSDALFQEKFLAKRAQLAREVEAMERVREIDEVYKLGSV